eukprot:TRINITY_DN16877_c0_g1_i1.p1 TRINITY_DN16877_c0_g1~~TRINITY_DN16877_c0_g1_i1.p1  ORF type:complete len:483 (+),score=148.40 TRINITY_DN16877_c0_g1_i1:74-1450(+)
MPDAPGASPPRSALRAKLGVADLQPASDLDLDAQLKCLQTLGSDLTSPARERASSRRVRFSAESYAVECNVDKVERLELYHNGHKASFCQARRRPGQEQYQIFSCEAPEGRGLPEKIPVDPEQPFKAVLSGGGKEDGPAEYTFTGCMQSAKGDSSGTSVVALVPARKGQFLRLRMDLLLDTDGRHVAAVLVSAGRAPSHTALQRLQGYLEAPATTAMRVFSPRFVSVLLLQVLLFLLVGPLVRTPAHRLYEKWRISHDAELLSSTRRIIQNSRTLRREFGAPAFAYYDSLFDYQVDLYTDERASFLVNFQASDKVVADRTKEWELEGTQNTERDDEITVKFDRHFRYGEAKVEAVRAGPGGPWHHTSLRLDLYPTERNYADTMMEWLVETMQNALGSGAYQLQIEERAEHLRIKLEIGQDSDRDGDAEAGEAGHIIRETAQLVHDRRVVGFLTPDTDA